MNRYYYDLHIHSCLSPCGDNDMTPNNIAGVCALAGLQIAALTDHNSVKNCPAFYKAAKSQGIIPVPGMELTTAEEIHVVCLFERLEDAMAFGEEVETYRVRIPNRVDIFGDQLILNEEDEPIGVEDDLLPNATMLSLWEVPPLVEKYSGVCYPAHIDREANGIVSILGTVPRTPISAVWSCGTWTSGRLTWPTSPICGIRPSSAARTPTTCGTSATPTPISIWKTSPTRGISYGISYFSV